MFMITAISTAIIIENDNKNNSLSNTTEKLENIGVERINNLRKRKEIINNAKSGSINYDEEIWNFITSNKIDEVLPFILKSYSDIIINSQSMQDGYNLFHKNFVSYIKSLEDDRKAYSLYDIIENKKTNN